MLVKFAINLGSNDTDAFKKQFGVTIDHKRCTAGAELEVPDSVAELLIKRSHAEPCEKKVKAVAKEPTIGPAK